MTFAVVSAIVGTKKPDRRIFERALEQAGVEAPNAAHIGDMYLEDILGARNVGVRPFLIDRGRKSLFPSFPEAAEHSPEEVEIVRGLDADAGCDRCGIVRVPLGKKEEG